MHVTVTGAGGFIGRRLVRELLRRGTIRAPGGTAARVEKVVACDVSLAGLGDDDPRLARVEADVSDPAVLPRVVTSQTGALFHLAAVVSVGAEEDFELGMRVNFDTTRALLDACRRACPNARGSLDMNRRSGL